VRVALITLAGRPLTVAGKTLAQRQLEFALAAGAERIVVLGDGASPAAIALRHAAERAGARFQAIRDVHGLLGSLRADEELLVLAPALLPDNAEAIGLVGHGSRILVIAAQAGVAAGFERIDLERAWGGALVMPGRLIERLAELAADSEAAPALLRVALQANLAERRVPEVWLADGSWAIVADEAEADARSRTWLLRHLPTTPLFAPSRRAANIVLKAFGTRWLTSPLVERTPWVATAALLVAAAVLCWIELPVFGFVMLALGSFSAVVAGDLAALAHPAHAKGREPRSALELLVDLALVACIAGAIDGGWLHRLFPPLVLAGALRASRIHESPNAAALMADRGLLALLMAAAAVFGLVEPVAMALALLIIGVEAAKSAGKSG
jgi:hypothetical protein